MLSDKVLQEIIAQIGAVGQRLCWRLRRARVLGHCVLLCQFSTTGVCQLLIGFLIAFPWLKAQGYQEPEGALKGPLLLPRRLLLTVSSIFRDFTFPVTTVEGSRAKVAHGLLYPGFWVARACQLGNEVPVLVSSGLCH